jgi:hypothetical protein
MFVARWCRLKSVSEFVEALEEFIRPIRSLCIGSEESVYARRG